MHKHTDGSSTGAGLDLSNNESVTIGGLQRVRPRDDAVVDLGSVTKRFRTLHYQTLEPAVPQGFQGRIGPQGGGAGTEGPMGPQGMFGAQGLFGAQGPVGTAGANGTNGTNGADGKVGAQGSAGADGTNGTDGKVGAQGSAGTNGTGGTLGPQGAVGPTGGTGGTGPVGAQGPAGWQGAVGNAGAPGGLGAQGPMGSQGAISAIGPQGTAGATGATGATGTFANPSTTNLDMGTHAISNVTTLNAKTADNLVTGPTSATSGHLVQFSGTTGRVLASAGASLSSYLPLTGGTLTGDLTMGNNRVHALSLDINSPWSLFTYIGGAGIGVAYTANIAKLVDVGTSTILLNPAAFQSIYSQAATTSKITFNGAISFIRAKVDFSILQNASAQTFTYWISVNGSLTPVAERYLNFTTSSVVGYVPLSVTRCFLANPGDTIQLAAKYTATGNVNMFECVYDVQVIN